jgi:peptidoglycan/xylan/chitin deacetylase (PgdA/CDA1 family)
MATQHDFVAAYQWDYRPRLVERPAWFTAWPGGARVGVTILILHEWESVPRPVRPMPAGAHYNFDTLALGAREYGARFGVWRLLDVVERHGVRATLITNGLVAELFPESIQAAHARGHEVAVHQWDQSVHPPVFSSREEERESLVRAVGAVEQVTGERPLGYMSQGPRPTLHTLDICAELGFVWTADYSDSDVPYLIDVHGKPLVSVGYVMPAHTDNDLVVLGAAAGLQQLKDAFDAVYEEAEQHPMKFCYAAHTHISGRPAMARLLDAFLEHARRRPGVWFGRGIDVAKFWLGQGSG